MNFDKESELWVEDGGGGGGRGGCGANIETKTVSQTVKRGIRQNSNHLLNVKHVVQSTFQNMRKILKCKPYNSNFEHTSKSISTKNPNLKIFFLVGRGWGEVLTKKITNMYLLIFCARALYKISSSWLKWFSSYNTNKKGNRQVRSITLPLFSAIQSKFIFTWILNNLLNFRILAQAILYILC